MVWACIAVPYPAFPSHLPCRLPGLGARRCGGSCFECTGRSVVWYRDRCIPSACMTVRLVGSLGLANPSFGLHSIGRRSCGIAHLSPIQRSHPICLVGCLGLGLAGVVARGVLAHVARLLASVDCALASLLPTAGIALGSLGLRRRWGAGIPDPPLRHSDYVSAWPCWRVPGGLAVSGVWAHWPARL